MHWIFIIVLLLLAIGWYHRRWSEARRLIGDLREALEKNQDLLIEADGRTAARLGLDGLLRVLRQRMTERRHALATHASQMEQIETTFRNMREGAVVLDAENRILVANTSAEELLNEGRELGQRRIERFIHHPVFLDFVREVKLRGERGRRQIEVDLLGKAAWLEISGAPLDAGPAEGGGRFSLFLLHDITRLKKLEAIRRDFAANVSHELRTPITIIKGFAETLHEDADRLSPERRKEFIAKIHRNVDRLHALVEDLLALSRLESRESEPQREIRSLAAEIRSFAAEYRAPAAAKAVLEVELPEEEVRAPVDPRLFERVLTNLADNAFKHGETNTFVKISLRRDEASGLAEIAVIDDGVGIPERARERVFQRFYRLDQGRSSRTGGTGLGLSIVRHAMLSMGGRARIEAREGGGTVFVCVLPLAEEAA